MIRLVLALAWPSSLIVLRLPSLVQPMGADQGCTLRRRAHPRAAGCPIATRGIRSRRPSTSLYAAMRALWPRDAVVAGRRSAGGRGVRRGCSTAWDRASARAETGAACGAAVPAPVQPRLHAARRRAAAGAVRNVHRRGGHGGVSAARRARANRASAARRLAARASCSASPSRSNTTPPSTPLPAWWRCGCGGGSTLVDARPLSAWVSACRAVALLARVRARRRCSATLYDATILYNLQYSGETYAGASDFAALPAAFPVEHARVDALWTLGGAGCLLLLAGARAAIARGWCRSSGSRPRACRSPSTAAAGCRSTSSRPRRRSRWPPAGRAALAWAWLQASLGRSGQASRRPRPSSLVVGDRRLARQQFPSWSSRRVFDARYALGRIAIASTYLARYERRPQVLGARRPRQLAGIVRAHDARRPTASTCSASRAAAYVHAERASASRFFWSRPVIVGFNAGKPGYGVERPAAGPRAHRPGGRRACSSATGRRMWTTRRTSSWPRRRSPDWLRGALRAQRTGRTGSTSGCGGATRRERGPRDDRSAVRGVAHRDRGRRAGCCVWCFPPPIRRGTHRSAIVWHDEGAWVHNARNKALFGAWTPGRLEPDVHRAGVHGARVRCRSRRFGVGVWQARLVSELPGCASVLLLAFGVRRLAGREAGAHRRRAARDQLRLRDVEPRGADGSHRWSRSWWRPGTATCGRRTRAAWGWAAGACALLAFFTKAAAAFFVGALGARCAAAMLCARRRRRRSRPSRRHGRDRRRSADSSSAARSRWPSFVLPELDRLPLLQLADVRHAQAQLRPAVAIDRRHVVSRSCTTSSRGCGSCSCWASPRCSAPLARWRRHGSGRTAARALVVPRRRSSCSCTTSATSAASSSSFRRWWRWRPSRSAAIGAAPA